MKKNTSYLLVNNDKPTVIDLPTTFVNNQTSRFVYMCSFVANLLLMTGGCMQVWLSPVIVQLKSNNTDINPVGAPIKTLEISILAAIPDISLFFGLICNTLLANKFGRKQIMLYSAVIISFGLIVIAFAKNIYIYYFFLSMVNVSLSFIFVNVPVYSAEIADTHNRARIGCLVGLAMPSGVLVTYVVGYFSGFTVFTLACAVPVFIFLLTTFFIVESPVYFILKNKTLEALQSLERLRKDKNPKEIEVERDIIEQSILATTNRSIFDLFKSASTKKALFLSVTIAAGQQMSGIVIILTFMASIFSNAGSDIPGNAVGIIIGLVQLIIVLVTIYIIENVGRRCLLLCSIICCAICMTGLGVCFYLKENDSIFLQQFSWLPVLVLTFFIIGYGFGLGPIPMTLVTELFPSDLRCASVAIYFITMAIVGTVLNFAFPLLSELFGIYCCMFMHGICTFFTFIILYYSLPETKGKTLSEIQYLLDNNFFSI